MSELLEGRDVPLGRHTVVRRMLPNKVLRTVGAWCFLDHFGPDSVSMEVPPHPHIGLQTVTWLFDGEIRHRDSLGSDAVIRPGQLNIMTSGSGISHSENSPPQVKLHGLQLWVALPDRDRRTAPRFQQLVDLPTIQDGSASIVVAVGELAGVRSPARVHSELLGAEVTLADGTPAKIPINPAFEHAVVATDGAVHVDEVEVPPGTLLHLGPGRTSLRVRGPGRLFVIGGVPFDEQLVMWWNFVARSHEEIVEAREHWSAGGFGTVPGGQQRLPAPALPTTRLMPRPGHRN